jgi:hypothetical protein
MFTAEGCVCVSVCVCFICVYFLYHSAAEILNAVFFRFLIVSFLCLFCVYFVSGSKPGL